MKILITGSHGLVGTALRARWREGHQVLRLVRTEPRHSDEVRWVPPASIEAEKLNDLDAVIHLAGENLAKGRWTERRKRSIRESRVQGTGLLATTLAALTRPPRMLLSASATGYYGNRGEEVLTEQSPAGAGFLAQVCCDWEGALLPAAEKGIRVVCLRFGIILSAEGGALAKMLPLFKSGLGGRLGSGRQFWSWVTLEDAVAAIEHAMLNDSLRGPVNIVSPSPVTNRAFTRALGQVLHRPALIPVPAFALRLAVGEMADEALLASTRVVPQKLLDVGYRFQHTDIREAFRAVCRPSRS